MCKKFIFGILAFIGSISISSGHEWEICVVDSSETVCQAGTSIEIDANDYPHISYITDPGGVSYAFWDGFQWQIQRVFSGGCAWRSQTSLALDRDDYPHIVHGYNYGMGGSIKYSFGDGTKWQHSDYNYFPFREGLPNDIALDDSGDTHISYIWSSDYNISAGPFYMGPLPCGYTIECCSVWHFDGNVSLAIDKMNSPHLCYNLGWTSPKTGLKYAVCNGGWQFEQVDSVPQFFCSSGKSISFALDMSDKPHVSYYDDVNQNLKWARKTDQTWAIGHIDSIGKVGSSNSLVLDNYGFEHISFYDATHKDLKCAHWNGIEWETERVDTLGEVGNVNSIAIDKTGCLHISYYDTENGFLKYALSRSVHTCSGSKGDIDNNGSIDVIDIVAIVRHILGEETLEFCGRVRADCNANGSINIKDVIGIVNVLLEIKECEP